MEQKTKKINRKLKSNLFSPEALMNAIPDEYDGFLKPRRLFVAHYNGIPCEISLENIDGIAALKWFTKHNIKEIIYEYKKNFQSDVRVVCEAIFCLRNEIMVHFNVLDEEVQLFYQARGVKKVGELIKKLKRFQYERLWLPEMFIMLYENGNLGIEKVPINLLNLDIASNYNDDFVEIDKMIQDKLNGHKENGLVLLHGAPGTGKTSYLRYLIASVNKKVIFMPPNIAMEIGEPSLMAFLIKHSNSIFVIEDAENLVKSREGRFYSPVAALLNLCDGLISDFLKIQMICTCNTDISKIDAALLRKGRLIASYAFRALSIEKAQALSDGLGFKRNINAPMCLSDIYNMDEKNFEQIQRACIGFKPSQTA